MLSGPTESVSLAPSAPLNWIWGFSVRRALFGKDTAKNMVEHKEPLEVRVKGVPKPHKTVLGALGTDIYTP